MDRKDMEIYGQTGQVLIPQPDLLLVRTQTAPKEAQVTPPALTGADADPVSYFAAVVRKEIVPSGLSSLDVNVTVVEILDAAHQSARTGKKIKL
jgi:predicted dehydrogenase